MTGGTQLDVQAILPCNAHQYFVERDSAAFRALIAKALRLGVYSFRDTWQEGKDGSTFVRLVTKPEISSWVPSAVRNAVANASEIEFHDIIEYKPSDTSGPSYTLHVRTESPFLGDKLRVNTTLELTPLTENTTLQRLYGTVCVRMFGMGGLIEKAIRDNMVKTYHQLPEIVSRWETYRAEFVKEGDTGILLAGRPPVGGDLAYVRSIMQAPLKVTKPIPSLKGIVSPTKAELLAAAEKENVAGVRVEIQDLKNNRKKESIQSISVETNENIDTSAMSDGHLPNKIPLHKEEETQNLTQASGVPRHARRRTASSLILDALPTLDLLSEERLHSHNNSQQQESTPPAPDSTKTAATTVTRAPRHWRGFSWDSVGSQGAEAPIELESRGPGSKGAYTAWRRFNRDYAVWETYWAQIGVHAATAAQQGIVKIFHTVLAEVAAVGRLFAIVLLLLLVRLNILRVDCSVSRNRETSQQQGMKRRSSSRLGRTSSIEMKTAPPAAAVPGRADNNVEQRKNGDINKTTRNTDVSVSLESPHGIISPNRNKKYRWFSLRKSKTF